MTLRQVSQRDNLSGFCRLFLLWAWSLAGQVQSLPPVVLVPGLAGSLLDADIKRKSAANPFCQLQGVDNLWFNKKYFVPGFLDCWVEEMQLSLDVNGSKVSDDEVDIEPKGVHVHTKNYGSVGKALFDYGQYHGNTGIWMGIIEHLKILGYKDKEIHAVPYDWRRGPAFWKKHDWVELKAYAEKVVKAAHGVPALFISVSLGGPYFASFLHHAIGIDAVWKKEHVAAFVTFSGVFGGTAGALGLSLWGSAQPLQKADLGYDVKLDFLGTQNAKHLLHGWGGVSYLIPFLPRVGNSSGNRELVRLPPAFHGDVKGSMLPSLLTQVDPELGELYELGRAYPISDHPGVKVLCFYGTKLPSPSRYVYNTIPSKPATSASPQELLKNSFETAKESMQSGRKPDEGKITWLLNQANDIRNSYDSESKQDAPDAPDEEAEVGSTAWIDSVSKLLDRRRPDQLETTPGDGLVDHQSLAVCDDWKGKPGLPDVEVHQIEGAKHGSEIFNGEALLTMRAGIAKIAGVRNPANKGTQHLMPEHPNGKTDMKHPLGEFEMIVGPMVARWSCADWVKIYGEGVASRGCPVEEILASKSCDAGCHRAFAGDRSFLQKRCPQTCKGSKVQGQKGEWGEDYEKLSKHDEHNNHPVAGRKQSQGWKQRHNGDTRTLEKLRSKAGRLEAKAHGRSSNTQWRWLMPIILVLPFCCGLLVWFVRRQMKMRRRVGNPADPAADALRDDGEFSEFEVDNDASSRTSWFTQLFLGHEHSTTQTSNASRWGSGTRAVAPSRELETHVVSAVNLAPPC